MKFVVNDLDPYPTWWSNYIMSFNDSVQFAKDCDKLGIKFKEVEREKRGMWEDNEIQGMWKDYEIHFPDEQTFTWFVLRWS